MRRVLITMLALFSTSLHAGTVYKCTDDKGRITYQDVACPEVVKAATVVKVQGVALNDREKALIDLAQKRAASQQAETAKPQQGETAKLP